MKHNLTDQSDHRDPEWCPCFMDVAEWIWVLLSPITLASMVQYCCLYWWYLGMRWPWSATQTLYMKLFLWEWDVFHGSLSISGDPNQTHARYSARHWGTRMRRHSPCPKKLIIQCGELDLRVYSTRGYMNNRLSEGWFLSFSPRLTCIGINWEVCLRHISAPLLPHESESLGVELWICLFNMPYELLYCRHFDSNTTIRWKRKASFEYWCWRNSLQGLWCWVWSWLLFYNRWFWTILFLVKHLILASPWLVMILPCSESGYRAGESPGCSAPSATFHSPVNDISAGHQAWSLHFLSLLQLSEALKF